ncbi:MAG: hypothetical protein LBV80_07780 [Deltaproteobacteria bacterium]|jgi:hypothetical protein|nr:hypothetical protein [Deltaproteobacteria bacterium]
MSWGFLDKIFDDYSSPAKKLLLSIIPDNIPAVNALADALDDHELLRGVNAHGATPNNTANALVSRDAAGRISISPGIDNDDAVNMSQLLAYSALKVWVSANQAISRNVELVVNHALNLSEDEIKGCIVDLRLVCLSPEYGYVVGDVVRELLSGSTNEPPLPVKVKANTVSVFLGAGSGSRTVAIAEWRSGAALCFPTPSNWQMQIAIFY